MKLAPLLKALPALIGLLTSLFGKSKTPPKRAGEVLKDPDDLDKAREEAEKRAAEKFGS